MSLSKIWIAVFCLKSLFCFIAVLIGIETYRYPTVILEAISVPPDLEIMGYTAPVMARHLLDSVQEYAKRAGIIMNDIREGTDGKRVDLNLQPQDWSVKLVAAYLNALIRDMLSPTFMGKQIAVGGELAYATSGHRVLLNLRIDGAKLVTVTARKTDPRAISVLSNKGAVELLKELKPTLLASYYFKEKQLAEFEDIVSSLLRGTETDRVKGIWFQGHQQLYSGNPKEAINKYKKVIALDPRYVLAHYEWGRALNELGRSDQAIRKFWTVIGYQHDHVLAHYEWGIFLAKKGECDKAIRQLKNTSRMAPNFPDVHYSLGRVHGDLGEYKPAVEYYERATELNPALVDAFQNWGALLYRMEDFTGSAMKFKRVTQIEEENFIGYHNWGHALVGQGKDTKAIEQYKRALDINPEYWHAYLDLADVLEKVGRNEDAMKILIKLIEFGPNNPKAHRRLGGILYEKGDHDSAAQYMNNALEYTSDPQELIDPLHPAIRHPQVDAKVKCPGNEPSWPASYQDILTLAASDGIY